MRRYKTGKNLSLPTYPFIAYLAGQIAENEKKNPIFQELSIHLRYMRVVESKNTWVERTARRER